MLSQWKTICYAGAGYLYDKNGQYDNQNLTIAIRQGTMIMNWFSTRHGLAEKAITFRMNTEVNCSTGHYIVQIEVRNDRRFRGSGWTVEQLRKWYYDDKTQKEIFGS